MSLDYDFKGFSSWLHLKGVSAILAALLTARDVVRSKIPILLIIGIGHPRCSGSSMTAGGYGGDACLRCVSVYM